MPATKEPVGLTHRDGKCLDGTTQIPEKMLVWTMDVVWEVTVVSTLADSISPPQPVDVERWPNSLLYGNTINIPTSLQHTLSFQSPWRPWAQWTTLHTIFTKTLAARLAKSLVTAEKGRSFSSGCQSVQRFKSMRPCNFQESFTWHDHPTYL